MKFGNYDVLAPKGKSLAFTSTFAGKKKVKFYHTRYRALGPELIPVYRQSARK